MGSKTWSDVLWGRNAKTLTLFIAAAVLLFAMLGSREIWTQEHRWADIVYSMFFRHDYLHPYLDGSDYYDKPLLSYWLVVGFTYITGQFSTWALRLPSALAGVLAIWSIYRIGSVLHDKRLGLLAGWLLLTTYYFIFWARTSSADMLNLGGTLFAVCWYFEKKSQPGFFNYAVFFFILALTSLCKGLVGAIVPLIVILPDMLQDDAWKKHLRSDFFLAMLPALGVYIFPFWASSHFGGNNYGENGLALVYRENVLRYFQPFDHKGPIYTYFLYLPVYMMPWAVFFLPALFTLKSRWQSMSTDAKNMCWSVLLLFLFFTLSGSRRNYYVLPIVPFAILMTAQWILASSEKLSVWAGRIAVLFFAFMFLSFDVAQPLYYAFGGMHTFAADLKQDATKIKPWEDWQFVLLDPESKTRFYLSLPPTVEDYGVLGPLRGDQTERSLLKAWPVLRQQHAGVIYISRKLYEPILRKLLPSYRVIEGQRNFGERFLQNQNLNAPVAFVPPG